MDEFKLFNKKFYLDKITQERAQLQEELHKNYGLIDTINSSIWSDSEKDYTAIFLARRKLHSRNKQIRIKLNRLAEDYKRYSEMDI